MITYLVLCYLCEWIDLFGIFWETRDGERVRGGVLGGYLA